ncbi:hypothetical protein AAG589_16140 [Isoptericola sp. F-RaC21]|uniref:hypothetical protein n=1 Tax=Isoptericola sp. F-RaC21 TaxID=3141452 RepID=UPI00315BB4AD
MSRPAVATARPRRVLVVGPYPSAAGHVAARRAPADPVIDLHAVHVAVGGGPGAGRIVALSASHAARKRAERLHDDVTVWVVHPDPTPDQRARYLADGYELVDTGPPPDEMARRPRVPTGTAANAQAATKRHEHGISLPPRVADDGGA